jgi:DNA repair protein RadC
MKKNPASHLKPKVKKSRTHKGEGHRKRLREKFLNSGLDGFHDYEVIELLLTLATPRKDCKDAAKAALNKFKTLQGVFEASPESLCEVPGIGPKNLFGIKLIKAAADRYLKKRLIRKNPLNNSKELFEYLYHRLRDKPRECFKAVFLDAKNKVISAETLFEGTLTASSVYPREVVLSALNHRAAAVIFAHNHPSGDPKPSQEDIAITRRLIFALKVIDITVHEHIIVGNNCYFSFADEGYMVRMHREYDSQVKVS